MTIYFYRLRDPYGAFSNHSPHSFMLDGLYWPTIEHYYQAQKFVGTPCAEQIRLAAKPMDAKRLGRSPDWPLRPDWEAVKEAVIFRATLAKYETHADVRAMLLATGDEALVENSSTDYYWGCGADGSGQNRYGQVLMAVRTHLRRQRCDCCRLWGGAGHIALAPSRLLTDCIEWLTQPSDHSPATSPRHFVAATALC